MKQNNMSVRNTRFLTELAVLTAIELILELSGLGYIHTKFLEFTIMQIPVIVGAIVLGPIGGLVLGSVFGLTSFWQCFGKSPFGATLLSINPLGTFATCVIPRVAMGLVCAYLFRLLYGKRDKLFSKLSDRAGSLVCCGIVGLSGALLNTVLFMGFLVAIFGKSEFLLSFGSDKIFAFVVGMVGVQGLIEAVICCVVSASISHALLRARK